MRRVFPFIIFLIILTDTSTCYVSHTIADDVSNALLLTPKRRESSPTPLLVRSS